MEEGNGTFQTEELTLAAALISLGCRYEGMMGVDPRRFQFVFEQDGEIAQLEAEYYRGSLMVEVASFANALRRLKRDIAERRGFR